MGKQMRVVDGISGEGLGIYPFLLWGSAKSPITVIIDLSTAIIFYCWTKAVGQHRNRGCMKVNVSIRPGGNSSTFFAVSVK